jgi:hypothetical protein
LTSTGRSIIRRSARYAGRFVAVVALLGLTLVTTAAGYLSTRAGKAALLDVVLDVLDEALPGRIDAGELVELGLGGVVLEDVRVFAPAGNEVIAVGRLSATVALPALLRGQISIRDGRIEGGHVDLRRATDPDAGLVGAFVSAEPAGEPSGAPAPVVSIESVQASGLSAMLPEAPALGALELRQVEVAARIHVGGALEIEAHGAKARLYRSSGELGQLELDGSAHTGQASRLRLRGTLCGAALSLTARSVALDFGAFTSMPLETEIELGGWSPRELGCLLGEAVAASLPPGPSRAKLHTGGNLEHLTLTGEVAGAAGTVRLTGEARALAGLNVRLETSELWLGALHAGLPNLRLATQLDVALVWHDTGAIRVVAEARSQLEGTAVPPMRLKALVDATSLREIELRVADGVNTLSVTGAASLNGAARLHANGRVELGTWSSLARAVVGSSPPIAGRLGLDVDVVHEPGSGLEVAATFGSDVLGVEGVSLERVDGRVSVKGRWPGPAVELDVRFGDQRRQAAATGRLQVSGAQRKYTVEARGQVPVWGHLDLRGSLELLAHSTRVTLSGTGSARGAPWQVELPHGELFEDGRASFPGALLSLDGQRARLSATRSRAGWSGTAELARADLSRLLAPFRLDRPLRGSASVLLVLRGTSARPVVDVDVAGNRLGLGDGPVFEGRLHGSVDVRAATAELEADVREAMAAGEKPRLQVRLQVRLQAQGTLADESSWSRRLLHGQQHVDVQVSRLDSTLIEELLGEPSRLGFDVQGDLKLGLDRGRPVLQLGLRGSAGERHRASGAPPPPSRPDDRLELRLGLDGGKTDLQLSLADQTGPWLVWSGQLELAEAEAVPQLFAKAGALAALSDLVERAAWRTQLAFAPRPLTYVPLSSVPVELRNARLEARLEARRDRGHAPAGQLELALTSPERSTSRKCSLPGLVARLLVHLDADRIRAELDAEQGKRELLRARATGQLSLGPLLRGESIALTQLLVSADAERLQIGELPYWCGRVRGGVSTSARLQIAPGVPPSLAATIGVEGFSAGGAPPVDANLTLAVEPGRLHARGSLGHAPRRSTFELNLPLVTAGRFSSVARDKPVDGRLSLVGLEVAPFLADVAALSHASGKLDGAVTLGGTLGAPKLVGALKLEHGAFTFTELAQSLDKIGATIEFRESSLLIKRLDAHDGSGSLAIEGRIAGLGRGAFDAGFDVVARKFPLRQAGQVVATTSATARVDAGWRPDRRDVQIGLREVDTWLESANAKESLSLAPHPDLEVEDTRVVQRRQREQHTGKPSIPLSLRLDAGEQFWVKRADFGVKLTASLQLVDPGGSGPAAPPPSLTGNVGFDRGYLALLGRNFTVKPGGTLRFTGATAVVDLTAIYEDRRTDQVLEVHVSGSADAPKLDFAIDGAQVTPAEAMGAIYGNTDNDATIEDPNNAEVETKQFLSALTAGVLNASIRRTLGAMAPIVTLAPTDDKGGGELRAGFELDSLIPDFLRDVVTGVYVEGIFSSDKASEQYGRRELQPGVLMELFFPYNLVTSGRYGPDSTWSLDIGWHP